MQPLPDLYNPQDSFRGFYAARTQDFSAAGRAAGMPAASKDGFKIAVVGIDIQEDFVRPTGTLSVPGAEADTQRFVEFMYRNVDKITSTFISLDSHLGHQIFFSGWWAYEDDGGHPEPFTMLTLNSKGEIVNAKTGRVVRPLFDPLWSVQYVRKLKTDAQLDLMIWPYHTMIGTQGHALVPSLSEVLAYHSAARLSQVQYITKGTVPQVEHFGIFAPEVEYAKHPQGGLNTFILDTIAGHDRIYFGGQAKSHCVLASVKQFLKKFRNQPDILEKLYFLMDCTSSVQHPDVDFDALANAELAKMEQLGVKFVDSTDPI